MRVVIVAPGSAGSRAAIELRAHGFDDVTILERAAELGGTWFHNNYPGAACDVPSHLYSFSFAQRRALVAAVLAARRDPRLPARGRPRPRRRPARRRRTPRSRRCAWDDEARWTVDERRRARRGRRTRSSSPPASSTGRATRASRAETFAGHSFHSARVGPRLRPARQARRGDRHRRERRAVRARRSPGRPDKLVVFQRTGNWFLPRKNRPYPRLVQAIVRHVPGVQAFRRRFIFHYGEFLTLMIRHPRTWGRIGHARSAAFMRWQLRDPELRRKVWPDYTFGCKRVLFSSHFLPALQRPNVELVTERDRADDADRSRHRRRQRARGRLHHLRAPASGRPTSCSRWRSPAAAGARCARPGRTARTRTSGSPSPVSRRCS